MSEFGKAEDRWEHDRAYFHWERVLIRKYGRKVARIILTDDAGRSAKLSMAVRVNRAEEKVRRDRIYIY